VTVGRLVRHDGVKLTLTEARLVDAQPRAEVLFEQHILPGVVSLFPITKIADVFLVLTGQQSSVNSVHPTDSADAQGAILYTILLKKPQIAGLAGCRIE
jgi:hypothetical protein